MLDAALDFLPEGSRPLDDQIQWTESLGPLFRSLQSFPVEIAAGP